MYHRGGDRSWHQGHHQRDGPPPRNHMSRPYRGGYRDHREDNNYGQYHDYSPCRDRNYNDNQYMDHEEQPYHGYHEGNRQYHGNRDSRGQGYYREGRHDNSYQKDFHGGYQHIRPDKKYSYKSPKAYRKEDDASVKPDTPKPAPSVVHTTGHSIITDGHSEDVLSKDKNPEEEDTKHAKEHSKPNIQNIQDVTIPEDNTISTQRNTKLSEDESKFTECGAEPSEEDTELSDENQGYSKEGMILSDEGGNHVTKGVQIKQEDEQSVESVGATAQNSTELTTQPSCGTECLMDTKKDVLQTQTVIKEEEIPLSITAGKRAQSEDGDVCINESDREAASFFSKRVCTWQDEDQFHKNKTVQIPLLDGWAEMPSDFPETTGISTQRCPEPAMDYVVPDTAKELRKAFILAKKDEIELAFSQDCRTFAFVANTFLKKDPSMEVAVTNALRSTLQDIAGRCVQELRSFVEQYDNVIITASNRLQK